MKRNKKGKRRRERGAVSVFLVIILVPCMLVASIFVDVGRVYLSDAMAESAADMALNSLLTHYDSELNDWYGMVSSCQSIEEFYDASEKCFRSALESRNLTEDEVSTLVGQFKSMIGDDREASDFLRVSETGEDATSISAVDGANLANATMLKSQIVDFMKYRAPLAMTETVLGKIREGSLPEEQTEGLVQSEENKPLVEAKQDFCEAEAKLMEDSFYTYKQLYQKYTLGDPTPNNELLTEDLQKLKDYREDYRELHKLLITNLYNTEKLTQFNRAIDEVDNSYSYTQDICHSRVETEKYIDDGEEKERQVYYIDGGKLEPQLEAVKKNIEAFDQAKDNFMNKVNEGVSYLEGETNDIQYWKKADDIYNGSGNYRHKLNAATTSMVDSFYMLDAMMQCTPGNDLPDGYEETYRKYKGMVQYRQNKYLQAGKKDDSDPYLKLVTRLEKIAHDNIDNICEEGLYTSNGKTVAEQIESIAADLSERRAILKRYSDVLKVVINGGVDGKIKSLATLKKDAANYATELSEWSAIADDSTTTLAEKDREQVSEIKSSDNAGNITEASITELETRVVNIKKQIDDVLAEIEEFTYGGKQVYLIDSYQDFRQAATTQVSERKIEEDISNKGLSSYAETTFAKLFIPQGTAKDAIGDVNTADDHNLKLDVKRGDVAVPEVYKFWRKKYGDIGEEELKKYKSDKGDAESKEEHLEDEAKNKDNPHADSADIKAQIDKIKKTVGQDTLFSGFIGVIGNLLTGDLESIRDNLYLSTYMLEMFSYSTIDNEGRYDLLKDTGYDMKSLSKKTYENAYKKVDDKWASEELTDHYNKTLTNKMLNAENNAAYGCELEYILYGGTNDENIHSAYTQIYEIRYMLNLISAFQNFWSAEDSVTGKSFFVIADAIATATSGIVPVPIVKVVLIALLTVFETANDMNRLEAGFAVEIYKSDKGMWQISLDFDSSEEFQGESISSMMTNLDGRFSDGFVNSCENGMRYSDYLAIFIVCGMQSSGKTGESMTLRCAEIIENNMQKVTSNDEYRMENSKTYFTLKSQMRVDPLLITLPIYSDYSDLYDSESTDWCTYNINKTRGY